MGGLLPNHPVHINLPHTSSTISCIDAALQILTYTPWTDITKKYVDILCQILCLPSIYHCTATAKSLG